jgi:hypothetical protein
MATIGNFDHAFHFFAAAVNAETSGLLTNALGNGLALAVMIYSTAGVVDLDLAYHADLSVKICGL